MHDAAYAATGLDYKYVSIATRDLRGAVAAAVALGCRGLAISAPFKVTAPALVDRSSDEVDRIGACNTIHNADGVLVGHNTDCEGALRAIDEALTRTTVKRAVVVGSGGVARAIAYGLQGRGVSVVIASRSKQEGDAVVTDLSLDGRVDLEGQGRHDAQLVVNATPDARVDGPVRLDLHTRAKALMDVVFDVRETAIVSAARRRDWEVVPGWRMLLHQACRQFSIYTGLLAPLAAMEDALTARLR
jgi:shikimate dehydrogenase